MPELKLGTKFECFRCGTKFYDLGKSDAVCPKCGANPKDAAAEQSAAATQAARRKRKAEVVRVPVVVEEEEEAPETLDHLEEELEGADLGSPPVVEEEEEESDEEA